MNPAIWGGVSALGLGTADFMARFSSRAIGHASALFGVIASGVFILTVWYFLADPGLVLTWSGWHFVVINGIATTVMTLLLYQGLARGPVSVVAPIVASHPVLVVAVAVVLGAQPTALQWFAMAVTIGGVIAVAKYTHEAHHSEEKPPSYLRTTIFIALSASAAHAVLVLAAQQAVPIYGDFQALWFGRIVSLVALSLFFLARREAPTLPFAWWPFLFLQGLCDAGGYLALFAGSYGTGAEIAAVTASTFGAVTVILARVFLKELITWAQWLGIVLVFAGVALLSWPA
jgi:drug/metabolite transporter (DMT)-like permease